MQQKTVWTMILTLFSASLLTLAFNVQPVRASGTIYIRPDGAVEGTDKILREGNLYIFTDDIYDSIVVERDNIVVDGAGHTLQGTGGGNGTDLIHRSNVTIKNMEIKSFFSGIMLISSSNNIISGNTMTNNECGIYLDSSSHNTISRNNMTNTWVGIHLYGDCNTVYGNNIRNNALWGIYLYASSNNIICQNNFIDNSQQVKIHTICSANFWDDGYPSGGNYWSDYSGVDVYCGPNQNLPEGIGSDGIGDTPYVIDSNNRDHYPLVIPWTRKTLLHPVEGQYANYTMQVTNPSDGTILEEIQWILTYHEYVSPFLMYVMSWIDHAYSEWDWTALNITNRFAYHFTWPITGRIGDMWFPGWIETNITTGSTINLLDGTATVVGDKTVEVNSQPIDCWELFHIEESWIEHTFWFDKTTGLLIGQEALVESIKVSTILVDTNIIQLEPPSATEGIEELLGTIDAWDLPKGTEKSLTAKLEGAIHLLEIGNENGAIHKLRDFINQVEALRGKKLSEEQADYLTSEAHRIMDLIARASPSLPSSRTRHAVLCFVAAVDILQMRVLELSWIEYMIHAPLLFP